jgi:hypothetical protein
MDIKNQESDSVVNRDGHTEYKSNSNSNEISKWTNYLFQVPICILLIFVFFNIQKAAIILQEDLKNLSPIVVHDTTYIPAPKIYHCWQCKRELANVDKGSVSCCGFEYKVVNGELIAKKDK